MLTYEFNGAKGILHPAPHPYPWGRLDKSVSPRVGDVVQKSYPRPNYPEGSLGLHLIDPLQPPANQFSSCTHLFLMIQSIHRRENDIITENHMKNINHIKYNFRLGGVP